MRGTQRRVPCWRRVRRFIPAHAGNSPRACRRSINGPVHPRACGELRAQEYGGNLSHGSSPRMRGTLPSALSMTPHFRFIPAHAGNSQGLRPSRAGRTVHPRACGELDSHGRTTLADYGSSPRMRGTLARRGDRDELWRFIPAHAGNSVGMRSKNRHRPVHPRACGELIISVASL